jgi:hypothetical protein
MTDLAARLNVLGISIEELVAILRDRYTPAEIEAWIDGKADPDPEAKVLLRIVTDPAREHAARLAVARIRGRQTRDLRGDGATRSGIETVPYGTAHTGTDGEGWQ